MSMTDDMEKPTDHVIERTRVRDLERADERDVVEVERDLTLPSSETKVAHGVVMAPVVSVRTQQTPAGLIVNGKRFDYEVEVIAEENREHDGGRTR